MSWKVIESRQNEAVKSLCALSEKKVRCREGLIVAEGKTLFTDLLRKGIAPERVFVSSANAALREEAEGLLSGTPCEKYLLAPFVFEKVTTEKGSQGIVSLFSEKKLREKNPLCRYERLIALENLQDPGNVGTVIRTAAALGADGVLLAGCADPFSVKATRASMGAIADVPIRIFREVGEIFELLKEKGVHSVAACLSEDAVEIGRARLSAPVCVFIGNEGKGLSAKAVESAEEKAIIPISRAESLNAGVAAAIFLWEMSGKKGERT
ncbi:MAG: RNA methyltransferase [Clostridia bacterium]|nr:RNA methyltransferase [Clostridia bacterium]